jgi:hypothetical protein
LFFFSILTVVPLIIFEENIQMKREKDKILNVINFFF